MELTNLDYIFIILYFLCIGVVVVFSKEKVTYSRDSYILMNKNLNGFSFTNSFIASTFGGLSLATYSSLTFSVGFTIIWFLMGMFLALLVLIPMMSKLKELSQKHNFYSFNDFIEYKFGKDVGLLCSIIMVIFMGVIVISQFIVGTQILTALTNWSYEVSVLLMGLVVITYLLLGGFRSVVKTDIIQNIGLSFIVLLCGYVIISQGVSFSTFEYDVFSAGYGLSLLFLLYGFSSIIAFTPIWQYVYASKKSVNISKCLSIGLGIVSILALGIIIMSLYVKSLGIETAPEVVLVYAISELLPEGLVGLALVVIFAAIMSTVDSALFLVSMYASNDIIAKFTRINIVRVLKILIILFGIISTLIAMFLTDLIGIIMSAYNFALVLIVPIIVGLYLKSSNNSIFISMFLGAIAATLGLFMQIPQIEWIVMGVCVGGFLITELITKNSNYIRK